MSSGKVVQILGPKYLIVKVYDWLMHMGGTFYYFFECYNYRIFTPNRENMVTIPGTDPAYWLENISDSLHIDALNFGAVQVKHYKFSKSKQNCQFSPDFYT